MRRRRRIVRRARSGRREGCVAPIGAGTRLRGWAIDDLAVDVDYDTETVPRLRLSDERVAESGIVFDTAPSRHARVGRSPGPIRLRQRLPDLFEYRIRAVRLGITGSVVALVPGIPDVSLGGP
jgi:hypothetical protein